eukprot:1155427-Amphidinium_carterae.1
MKGRARLFISWGLWLGLHGVGFCWCLLDKDLFKDFLSALNAHQTHLQACASFERKALEACDLEGGAYCDHALTSKTFYHALTSKTFYRIPI